MPFPSPFTVAPVVLSFYSDLRRLKAVAGPFLMTLAILAGVSSVAAQTPAKPELDAKFGKVPLNFEPNRGQVDATVQYLSRGPGYSLFLTSGEAVLQLQDAKAKNSSTLRMALVGSDGKAAVMGKEPLPGKVNYFVGNDSSKWHTGIQTFGKVSYTGVYPGVDLVYYGNQRELEYDFIVAPGADAAKIALKFTGATPVIDKAGDLVLSVQGKDARFHKPVIYQLEGDHRVSVEGSYLLADGKVSFALGAYDHSKALVIDPILSYLTYIGGSTNDFANAIAVDSSGSAYIVGTTYSTDFPVNNAYSATNPHTIGSSGGQGTMFVSKFNPTGTALVYSTYLGSTEYTYGNGIAVDSGGNAYVGGYTTYGTYPTTPGAFQSICGGYAVVPQGATSAVRANGCVGAGQADAGGVLTKLNPAGNALVYSTYLSGNNFNSISAVAVDALGQAYVTGTSNANCGPGPYYPNAANPYVLSCQSWANFPITTGSAQDSTNQAGPTGSNSFAFLSKFNATGTALLYSSILGNAVPTGSVANQPQGSAIAVDANGNAYIGGTANFTLYTTKGAYQAASPSNNGVHGFVAKFDTVGQKIVYSTFVTTADGTSDNVAALAVDASGNAYVAGSTGSAFPTTAGVFQPTTAGGNGTAGFISKLNPTGSALVWSSFLGFAPGSGPSSGGNAYIYGLTLGPDGSVYVVGQTDGGGFPSVNSLFGVGGNTGFVSRISADGTKLLFSTPFGSSDGQFSVPYAVAVDASSNIYIVGKTNSSALPVTAGAFQQKNNTPLNSNVYRTGFVGKIAPTSTTTTALTLPTGTVTAGQSVKLTAKVTGQTGSTGTPTGTVTFLGGTTTLGTGTLDATGKATYTAASLNATTYSITASYAGDTAFAGSVSSAQNLVVTPATPTVILTAPATALVGASVTLSVTVTGTGGSPTGTVVFKDGATILSTVNLASGAASYSTSALTVGTHSITASYSGDSIFAATTTAAQSVVVSLGTATVSLTAPATALLGASVTLATTVTGTGSTPTGTVTFKDGTATLSTATLAGGAASYSTTTLAAGAHSITVSYSGDSNFAAATSLASTVTINVPPSISFAAAPATLTIVHGSSGTVTITGTPVGGYTGTVTFACGTLPSAAACTFSPNSLSFTGASAAQSTTLTFSTTSTTGLLQQPGLFSRTATTIVVALLLMPLGFARRSRRLVRGTLFALLLAVGLVAGLSGCSSTSKTSLTTPAGTYTVPITVTANGVASTLSVSVVVQ